MLCLVNASFKACMKRGLASFFLWLFLLYSCEGYGLHIEETGSIGDNLTILSWNVQNLFDDQEDGEEYLSYKQATGLWNTKTYYNKLESLYSFLGSLEVLPDVLIFQEVEKPEILKFLFERFLKKHPYKTLIGMCVAQPQVLVVTSLPLESIETLSLGLEGTKLRQAIKVSLNWQSVPLSIVGVHLKSWADKCEARNSFIREQELTALGEWLEPDLQAGRVIVIIGDLNARRGAKCDLQRMGPCGTGLTLGCSSLQVKDLVAAREDGTYAQKGALKWLDGILLAGELPKDKTYEVRVHDDVPHLRTQAGLPYAYKEHEHKGMSDHFPFSLIFKAKSTEN